MSIGYWLHNIAVRGCVIVALCVAGGYGAAFGESEGNTQPNTEQQQPAPTRGKADKSDVMAIPPKEENPATEKYEPDCTKPKDHDEANLCVQWRMAKAAEDALPLTGQQVWVGWFSFGGVLVSLLVASYAAWASWQSANFAGRTARIMEDTAERQLRAYVGATKAGARLINMATIECSAVIRNAGQTPTEKMRIIAAARIAEKNALPFDEWPKRNPRIDSISILDPESIVTVARDISFEQRDIDSIRREEKAIFFWGLIEYEDAFHKARWYVFRYWASGPEKFYGRGDQRGWSFVPHPRSCEAGNGNYPIKT